MIGKIEPKPIFDSNTATSTVSSLTSKSAGFQSILEERLEVSRPLERMMLEFLSRTIETFLSITSSEEDAPFLTYPLSLNISVPYSQKNNQSSSTNSQPVEEASKNLQENQNFEHIVGEASRKYDVDPVLIKAVIETESFGNPHAVSPAGAQGLMQLMPRTASELGVDNPFDPAQNIMAGARYLRQLLDRYQGDLRLTLAAYNWGMGNLEKRPEALPKETQRYIMKVENHYRAFLKTARNSAVI